MFFFIFCFFSIFSFFFLVFFLLFERRPSRPPLFLGLGPYVPHYIFIMLLICFFLCITNCLHFLSFLIYFFFLKTSLFFFLFVFFFFEKMFTCFIFQVGEEGVRGANPNPKLVSVWEGSLGFGESGNYPPPRPSPPPQTSN